MAGLARVVFAFFLLVAAPVAAEPVRYALEPDASTVGFEWDFGEDVVQGRMPVRSADLIIDFEQVSNSRVNVTLDAAAADAGFGFATQAMTGPKVLATETWPDITFESARVRRSGEGARVEGDVTIRGVTRPMALDAVIYRQRGTEEGDRTRLTVVLKGVVMRSDFGATGWGDMVGDEVRLTIVARIERIGG